MFDELTEDKLSWIIDDIQEVYNAREDLLHAEAQLARTMDELNLLFSVEDIGPVLDDACAAYNRKLDAIDEARLKPCADGAFI